MAIEQVLNYAIEKGGSDIHISVGRPRTVRIHGELISIDDKPLTSEDTEALVREITTEEQRKRVEEVGGIDFGFTFSEKARFRVSCFKQKGTFALVLRLLPSRFFSFDDIGLPKQLIDLLARPRGLILVCKGRGRGPISLWRYRSLDLRCPSGSLAHFSSAPSRPRSGWQ